MKENNTEFQTQLSTFDLGISDDPQVKDYHDAHGFSSEKTGFFGASANFYKSCVGSGVLGIPFAYTLGWGQGLIMFTVIPVMVIFTTILIVLNAQQYLQKGGLTLTQTVRQIVGNWGEGVTIFFLVFMQWGACASYLLFFIEFFNYAIFHSDDNISFQHQLLFLALAFCVIVPLIFVGDLGEFAKFSVVASSFIVFVLLMVTIQALIIIGTKSYYTYNIYNVYEAPNIKFDLQQVFFQAGVAMYTFEGIGLVFSVKRAMTREQDFPKVVIFIGILMTIQNLILGLGAAQGFGQSLIVKTNHINNNNNNTIVTEVTEGTQQIVLLSLNPNPIDYSMQILYSIALAITFPLQLFPIFQVVEGFQTIQKICEHKSNVQRVLRRTGFRFCQVIIIAIFALLIPNFATLISFVGGIGGSVLQFVIPLMVYIKTAFLTDNFPKRLLVLFICSVGIILGAGATIQPFVFPLPIPQTITVNQTLSS